MSASFRKRTVRLLGSSAGGAALFFLYANTALQFRGSLDGAFAAAACVFAAAAAYGLHRSRLRLPFALAAGLLLPLLARSAVLSVLAAVGQLADGTEIDRLVLAFDRQWWLLLVPLLVVTTITLLRFRLPAFGRAEPLVQAGLLLLVFWNQGGFRVTLYGHPLVFALALSIFVLLLLVELACTGGPRDRDAAEGRGGRRPGGVLSGAALVLGLGLLLAWVFGRYGEAAVAAGGGLLKPSLFQFDFSNYLTLESEIRQNRDLVLLYRRDKPIDRYLLRRYILDDYDPAKGFVRSRYEEEGGFPDAVKDRPFSRPPAETEGRERIGQEFYLVNLDPEALLSIDYPVEVRPLRNWKKSSFVRVYAADALGSYILPFELQDVTAPKMDADRLERLTRWGGDEKIGKLARDIAGRLPGCYDRVQAIHDYLKYEYFYSLRPGSAGGGNRLHRFLFETKKGYCSYFAFSMALLCRSLGIPARVAVGFYMNPESELFGFFPVRADMAHAWVEVYFNEYGWIDFDPTSETPAPGEEFETAPGFEKDKIAALLEEIIANRFAAEAEGKNSETEDPGGTGTGNFDFLRPLKVYWPFAVIGLLAAAGLARRFGAALRAGFEKDPRLKTTLVFSALLRDLACLAPFRPEAETVFEYAARLEAATGIPLGRAAELRQKALYGTAYGPEDHAAFKEALAASRKAYRDKRPAAFLFLRFVHPRCYGRPL